MHIRIFLVCFLSLLLSSRYAVAQQKQDSVRAAEPTRQLELFCGARLGYADTNWLRLFDFQIDVTPGVRWRLGRDWSVAFQGIIPVVSVGYTYRDVVNKYWRVNMVTVSRQLHFNNARQHLKMSAGLFGCERYGIDVKWAWPVSDWLLLNAQAGLSSFWMLGTDLSGNSQAEFSRNFTVTAQVGADFYLHPLNLEFRLSGGRYIAGDYGTELAVMRHFRRCTLLAYAQLRIGSLTANIYDGQSYRTDAGFKIICMLPPYKKSRRRVVVRPASNFQHSYSARGDFRVMQSYTVDPEENEREHPIDVNWGLRKEVTP